MKVSSPAVPLPILSLVVSPILRGAYIGTPWCEIGNSRRGQMGWGGGWQEEFRMSPTSL